VPPSRREGVRHPDHGAHDCRPTQGIDEAVARIEMYVEEGADILFLDSPADDAEIKRGIAAAKGRAPSPCCRPARRRPPSAEEGAALAQDRTYRPACSRPRWLA